MSDLTLVQLISAQVEARLYDQFHQLLGKISEDYDLSHGELVDRYLKYKKAEDTPVVVYKYDPERPKRVIKVTQRKAESDEQAEEERKGKCQGKTAKGLPCKNKSQSGTCFCHLHKEKGDESSSPTKKVEKKRSQKTKKIVPIHTHPLDQESHDCELCQSHGNAYGQDQEFEVVVDRDELRSMLADEAD